MLSANAENYLTNETTRVYYILLGKIIEIQTAFFIE